MEAEETPKRKKRVVSGGSGAKGKGGRKKKLTREQQCTPTELAGRNSILVNVDMSVSLTEWGGLLR